MSTPAVRSGGKPRVLIMDDEAMILELCALALGRAAFEVTTAVDGGAALEAYREALASGRPFAAVILDLNVPGGLGGLETLRALRGIDPAVRAFVSCGCPDDPAVRGYRDHGFAGVIAKPEFYLEPQLEDRLRTLLG